MESADPTLWVSEAETRREGRWLSAAADFGPPNGQPFFLDRSGYVKRHIVRDTALLQQRTGVDTGGDAAFHVAGSTAIENIAVDIA